MLTTQAAALPESPSASRISDAQQNRRVQLNPTIDHALRKRSQDDRNRCIGKIRSNNEMHVIRHDHPRDQLESVLFVNFSKLFDERLLDRVTREQR